MKRKIYELLTPKSIKESIYRANIRQFNNEEVERLMLIERSIPLADLSPVYIAHLRIVTERNSFLKAMPKHSVVAEIGVGKGDFSKRILSITNPRKLHLIDTWPNEGQQEDLLRIIENKFAIEIRSGQVAINQGIPHDVIEGFKKNNFDWIYLDSAHSYDHILRILEICKMKVKEGGIIAGRPYVSGSWLCRERYGVIEAVNRFCKIQGWELIYLTHESHRKLSYAIRRFSR